MTSIFHALIGRWEGPGHGDYPTIEPFEYFESVEFAPLADKPVLVYTQRTRSPDGKPLHAESGFLRFEGNSVELVVAQPTGIAEVHHGVAVDGLIEMSMDGLISSPTAAEVRSVKRTFRVHGDVLEYRLDMAAVGEEIQFHLEASLQRKNSTDTQ